MDCNIFHAIDNDDIDNLNSIILSNGFCENKSLKDQSFLYSCKKGQINSTYVLLENAHPNVRYVDGQTAIMLLCQNSCGDQKHVKLLEDIIMKGCNVDLVDYCGKNVLHWAVVSEEIWSIQTLIENGCSINSTDIIGYTPLMYATKSNNASIAELLLHNGADLRKNSKQHGTALHIAARFNCPETLRTLVKFCVDSYDFDPDCRNQTPIDLAVMKQNVECVNILVSTNHNIINRRPNYPPFRTPLEEACFRNNTKLAELLLTNGLADPNYPLEFSNQFSQNMTKSRAKLITPLMFAIYNRNIKIVQLLLEHGADVNIKCPKAPGHETLVSPISLASLMEEHVIFELLFTRKSQSISIIYDDDKQRYLEDIKYSIEVGNFEITSELISDFIRPYSNQSIESVTETLCELKCSNKFPALLLIFSSDVSHSTFQPIISRLSHKILRNTLLNDSLIELANRNQSGSIMKNWRTIIINFISYLQDWELIDKNIRVLKESGVIKFIGNHLYQYFMSNLSKNLEDFNDQIAIVESVFSKYVIRQVVHASKPLTAVLCSRSAHLYMLLVKYQFEEKLAFWNVPKEKQKFDVCELALFFGNLEAALFLNVACNVSLKCFHEYYRLPVLPSIMNENVEQMNKTALIKTLKKLSRTVKPLQVICRHTLFQSYSLHEFDGLLQSHLMSNLPQVFVNSLKAYRTSLAKFCFELFSESQFDTVDIESVSELVGLPIEECD